jgi:acyl carrier protein
MDDVEAALLDIIAKESSVERDKITHESTMEDLGIESIEMVEILFAIEEHFDIEVPYNANVQDAAGVEFNTVGDVIEVVGALVAKKQAASA